MTEHDAKNQDDSATDQPQAGMVRVMVEVKVPNGVDESQVADLAQGWNLPAFQMNADYAPIAVTPPIELADQLVAAGETLYVLSGLVEEARIPDLESDTHVVKVTRDTPIEPFSMGMM